MGVARISGAFGLADLLREAAQHSLDIAEQEPVAAQMHSPVMHSPVMQGTMMAVQVQPGLLMSSSDVRYTDDGEFNSAIGRSMTCGLLLGGEVEPLVFSGHPPIHHSKNLMTVVGIGEPASWRRSYRKDQHSQSFGLMIRPCFFDRFEGSVLDQGLQAVSAMIEPGLHIRHLPRSATFDLLIKDVLQSAYAGSLQDMFHESIALRFVIAMAQAFGEEGRLVHEMGRRRYDQVRQARDILDASLVTPPRTLDLARQIGTNLAGLQADFKKAYGTTLFGHVRARRLDMARILIAEHGLGSAEAGYKVGFTNASAFTAAYRRYFGHPPSGYHLGHSGEHG